MAKAYPNLEGLRFAAAASVVVWHYQHFAWRGTDGSALVRAEEPFAGTLGILYWYGENAVQVFWLLSGFVFFSQYYDRIASGAVGAREFAVRRFSRLYPLHLVTLLAVIALQGLYRSLTDDYFVYESNSGVDVALHLVFASQWPPGRGYSLNGPVWSVSLEILAYITFFIAARYLPKPYRLAAPALGLLVFGVGTHNRLSQTLALFFIGGGAWTLAVDARRSRAVTGALTAVWCAGGVVLLAWLSRAAQGGAYLSGAVHIAMYLWAALAIAGLAALPQVTGRTARAMMWLGDMTYSSYLTHFPLQLVTVTAAALAGTALDWRSPWLLAGYLAAVFVTARVVYDKFELPWQNRIRAAAGTMSQ